MLQCLRVSIFLGEAKVDDMNNMALLPKSHQEILRLDISMDVGFGMNILYSLQHLVRQDQDCLQIELLIAQRKQILDIRSQEVDDHVVIFVFNS